MAGVQHLATPSATQRRARAFFDSVIAEHGIIEGELVTIPMRQCELARLRNLAPSTIGAYLSALGPSVVARAPHIVITHPDLVSNIPAAAGDTASARARLPGRQANQPARGTGVDVEALVGAYQHVIDAQTRLIAVLSTYTTTTASSGNVKQFWPQCDVPVSSRRRVAGASRSRARFGQSSRGTARRSRRSADR
jgi:hypothetical protein